MVGTIICEVGIIMCDISIINVRFYLLEVRYPHEYCRISPYAQPTKHSNQNGKSHKESHLIKSHLLFSYQKSKQRHLIFANSIG